VRARGAEWRNRVDVPAPLRRRVDLRGDPGPRRRALHAGARRGERAGRTPLPAGDDGAGDDVGHAHGMGDRARRPADRPLAPPRRPLAHAPPVADRHGRGARAAAHAALRQRADGDAHGVRAAARLRAGPRALGVRRSGLRLGGRHGDRRGRVAGRAARHRPAARLRGRSRGGADDAARRPDRIRRAVLDRASRARDVRGGASPARLHRRPLARMALPRRLPRPSLAQLPPAQRGDAQGPHVRPHRRHGRGAHDVAAGVAGRHAQLGLPTT
jgi:hypothetical protein